MVGELWAKSREPWALSSGLVLLPGLLPVSPSSLPRSLFFFFQAEPCFHEGLEEPSGPAQAASLFFFACRVLKDRPGVGDRFFKEPSSQLLTFGGNKAAHIGVFGHHHAVAGVVFDHELFAKGALKEAKQEGTVLFHGVSFFMIPNLTGCLLFCKPALAK